MIGWGFFCLSCVHSMGYMLYLDSTTLAKVMLVIVFEFHNRSTGLRDVEPSASHPSGRNFVV